MRQAIDAAGPVLIAALLLVFGHGLLATLTSIQLANSDNATLLAGIAASAFFGGQMAGAIYGQRTLRSVGHIRAFSAFAALAAVVALLQPLLGIGWNWVLLRFLFGFGVVVMFLAMESWLNATVRNEARGSVFSMYMAIVYGGMAIGQGPIAILDMTASIGFTIAAICVMLASVPMSLTARAQPALDDDDPLSLRRIFEASPTGAISAVAAGGLIGGGLGLGPVYAQSVGLSESGVAAFMVVFLLAGLFASWPLGRLSDKVDRRIVIVAITFALAGAGAAGALAAQENFVLTFGLAAIFGLCALPLYSLAVAHANDVLEEHSPIATAGGMLIGFGFGAMAAPAAISFLMEQTSPAAFPALIGVIALATAIFVLFRMAATPTLLATDKTPYQSLPRTTAVAYALDPWASDEALPDAVVGAADLASPDADPDEAGWRDAWITSDENVIDGDEGDADIAEAPNISAPR